MIYLGCAGWNFKEWKDIFYPKTMTPNNWILSYSKNFNYLEINETYDKIWTKEEFFKLAEKTEFKLKIGFRAHKTISHLNINKSSVSENLTAAKHAVSKLEDLHNERWFGPVIIDFPYSFVFNNSNFQKIKAIIECFGNYKKLIEFQHKSWVNEEVNVFLSETNSGICLRDVPKFENLADDNNFLITSDFSYIKFYGRNSENWWQPLTEEEKTNYLYNAKTLNTWVKNIHLKLLPNIKDLYLVFCNIKNCYAIENARYLRKKFAVTPALTSDQLELPLFKM